MNPRPQAPSGARAPGRGARLGAINGVLALVAVLLIVQMWLLTATLEAFLAGHDEIALPAAIASAALFAAAVGLVLLIKRLD